eukprot:4387462-Amphidinium_carterae.1
MATKMLHRYMNQERTNPGIGKPQNHSPPPKYPQNSKKQMTLERDLVSGNRLQSCGFKVLFLQKS